MPLGQQNPAVCARATLPAILLDTWWWRVAYGSAERSRGVPEPHPWHALPWGTVTGVRQWGGNWGQRRASVGRIRTATAHGRRRSASWVDRRPHPPATAYDAICETIDGNDTISYREWLLTLYNTGVWWWGLNFPVNRVSRDVFWRPCPELVSFTPMEYGDSCLCYLVCRIVLSFTTATSTGFALHPVILTSTAFSLHSFTPTTKHLINSSKRGTCRSVYCLVGSAKQIGVNEWGSCGIRREPVSVRFFSWLMPLRNILWFKLSHFLKCPFSFFFCFVTLPVVRSQFKRVWVSRVFFFLCILPV